MSDRQHLENGVVMYLTQGRDALIHVLKPLLEQRKALLKSEDASMHQEIQDQFEDLIRREISREIATNMSLDPEQVYSIVETMNVSEFLGENPEKT